MRYAILEKAKTYKGRCKTKSHTPSINRNMKYLTALIFFLLSLPLFAQEQLGLRLERYAGTSGLSLNPTAQLVNPLRWDVNLAGASFFAENNYVFIENTNAQDLFRNRSTAEFISASDIEGVVPSGTYVGNYFDDAARRSGFAKAQIMGPAIAFSINEQFSIGLFSEFNVAFSAQGLTNDFSYFSYQNRGNFDPFTVKPFEGASMAWSAYGFNAAVALPTNEGKIGFGLNLKFLNGYEGFYFQNNSTIQYTKLPGDTVTFSSGSIDYAFTNDNIEGNDFQLNKNGSGFAVDLGAMMIIGAGEDDYVLKLGASILDVGNINFNKNAEGHQVITDSLVVVPGEDYENFSSIEDIDNASELFSLHGLSDPLASRKSSDFTIWLPTALSFQADYAFTENIFFNALLVQRIPLKGTAVERSNLLAFTPRFEHRWFSASLPLNLYNWRDFRMGIAVRLAFLVIGSDNLGSWFGQKDFSGTDAYIALKINPFNLGFNNSNKNKARNGKRRNGKVKCYDF